MSKIDYASPVHESSSRLLTLIAAFKIGKACLLFAGALVLRHLSRGSTQDILEGWMHVVRVDPDNRIAHGIISTIIGVPPSRLRDLGIGTFFYGLLFAIEGFGLLLKQRWAEYMTVITTTTFLPLEIYELIFRPHRKLSKAFLLVVNVAILVYLIANLVRARRVRPEISIVTGDNPNNAER